MGVHSRAGRMRMNLHEELADNFTSQAFAALRELPGGLPGAGLAAQADLKTELRVIVFHSETTLCGFT